MVIIIDKNASLEDIKQQLKDRERTQKAPIANFYGKMKGVFGDGLQYQKRMRE